MAYLRDLPVEKCAQPGCMAKATKRLMSDRNDPHGTYCTRHAGRALVRLQADERDRYEREGARE